MQISFRKLPFFLFLLIAASSAVFAQDDPNPDSPVPVLLSDSADVTRVLAVDSDTWRGTLPKNAQTVFRSGAGTTLTLFVTNVDLLADEGANAFRVYLKQKSGKTFQLPVSRIKRAGGNVYALSAKLFDNTRGQRPAEDGDALVYLTWRGLSSNTLRIALGKSGGEMKIPAQTDFTASRAADTPPSDYVGYRHSGDRMRFLEQATFGPTSELDQRIRRIGLRVWLGEQFDAPYPSIEMPDPVQRTINDASCQLTTSPSCFRQHYTMTPLQQWFFKEAMYGSAQLRHRTAWALSQIWVTSGLTVQQSSHQIAFHKILMKNAFGNYRNLMEEVTLSPTMGFYLDMVRSTKNSPNENYPREILQLFSIGLYMLNQDGTLKLDGEGNPIPTYSQETVNNLSKVYTGWSFCNFDGCPNAVPGIVNYKDPMTLSAANHDLTAKTLLDYPNAVSRQIPACADCTTDGAIKNYADESMKNSIDNIFYHPNVGPFVGKLLIQHLVTSDPSPAYVGRVAAAFNNNGSGVRGDMRAVIRAILLDPEARGNVKTAPRYGKLREPVQLLTNLTRIFPAVSFNGSDLSDGALNGYTKKIGQNPFYSPTVFNYFKPDYVIPGTTVLAPEFELLNAGLAINRTNLLYLLIFEGLTPNATDSLRGTSLTFDEFLTVAQTDETGAALVDALNYRMMHGALDAGQRSSILTAVRAVPVANPLLRVKTAVYLIAASSQYQVQR